jgi:hypothetical protein
MQRVYKSEQMCDICICYAANRKVWKAQQDCNRFARDSFVIVTASRGILPMYCLVSSVIPILVAIKATDSEETPFPKSLDIQAGRNNQQPGASHMVHTSTDITKFHD